MLLLRSGRWLRCIGACLTRSQPVGEPLGELVGEPVGEPVGELVGELVGEPVGEPEGEPMGDPASGRGGGGATERVTQAAGLLAKRSCCYPGKRPETQPPLLLPSLGNKLKN